MSDTATPVDNERRTSMCGDCGNVRGNPIANLIASGVQTITYRCPSCGRRWEESRRVKTETLFTK